jgi:fatty acid desaturase
MSQNSGEWNIYGKKYNLSTFASIHPGGAEIIEKMKDLPDCTAIFESYHAFSNIEGFKQTLAKYEIPNADSKQPYETDFSTYRELVKRVKTVFPDRASIKPPPQWYAWTSLLGFGYFYFLCRALATEYFVERLLFVLLSATTEISMMFNILHDASHYAISTDPLVNNVVSRVSNSWIGWNHLLWLYHHVYYHHTYTGCDLDTDKELYKAEKGEGRLFFIRHTLLPGQYLGQGLWYAYCSIKNSLVCLKRESFKLPEQSRSYYDWPDILIMSCKLAVFYKLGFFYSAAYIATENTLYFINIIGDHDLYETHENNYDGNDWALRQIRNSGNFANDNLLWTFWFGGINHQIEHHLFPNMCNVHYCIVASIVREFCSERGIPYVHVDTVEDAIRSFTKKVRRNLDANTK